MSSIDISSLEYLAIQKMLFGNSVLRAILYIFLSITKIPFNSNLDQFFDVAQIPMKNQLHSAVTAGNLYLLEIAKDQRTIDGNYF